MLRNRANCWRCGRDLPVAELPAAADEVIAECGRLPLALSVVGAMLRGESAEFWADTLDLLRKADLSAIEEQLPEGQESFFKAVEVSFQSLKPADARAVQGVGGAAGGHGRAAAYSGNAVECGQAGSAPHQPQLGGPLTGATRRRRREHPPARPATGLRARPIPGQEALELIHGALRLSLHVIRKDPGQFASQIVGRLLPYQPELMKEGFLSWAFIRSLLKRRRRPHRGVPAIGRFVAKIVEGTQVSWLRPLQATLHPPGTAPIRTLAGDKHYRVAMTPDGQRAVSASNNGTVKVLEPGRGRELRALSGNTRDARAVAAKANKARLGIVLMAAVTPDERLAVSMSNDETLRVWDVESGCELRTLTGHSRHVNCVALSADGRLAVSASDDKTLKVWETGSGRELLSLTGHSRHVNCVALSADGRLAVSASDDKTLKVWETGSGRELLSLEGHTGNVDCVALSANGRLAVSASDDKALKVWDVESGCELRTLTGHSRHINCVALSADGRLAVSASGEAALKVWELASGRQLRSLHGHTGGVKGVALSRDGRRAISASWDRTLKVWDVDSGRELRTLTGHSGVVAAVAVTPDGQRAVSASWDGTVKVWNLETGEVLATFTCDSAARCSAFSDALNLIVAGDAGGHVHFLRLEEPIPKK